MVELKTKGATNRHVTSFACGNYSGASNDVLKHIKHAGKRKPCPAWLDPLGNWRLCEKDDSERWATSDDWSFYMGRDLNSPEGDTDTVYGVYINVLMSELDNRVVTYCGMCLMPKQYNIARSEVRAGAFYKIGRGENQFWVAKGFTEREAKALESAIISTQDLKGHRTGTRRFFANDNYEYLATYEGRSPSIDRLWAMRLVRALFDSLELDPDDLSNRTSRHVMRIDPKDLQIEQLSVRVDELQLRADDLEEERDELQLRADDLEEERDELQLRVDKLKELLAKTRR